MQSSRGNMKAIAILILLVIARTYARPLTQSNQSMSSGTSTSSQHGAANERMLSPPLTTRIAPGSIAPPPLPTTHPPNTTSAPHSLPPPPQQGPVSVPSNEPAVTATNALTISPPEETETPEAVITPPPSDHSLLPIIDHASEARTQNLSMTSVHQALEKKNQKWQKITKYPHKWLSNARLSGRKTTSGAYTSHPHNATSSQPVLNTPKPTAQKTMDNMQMTEVSEMSSGSSHTNDSRPRLLAPAKGKSRPTHSWTAYRVSYEPKIVPKSRNETNATRQSHDLTAHNETCSTSKSTRCMTTSTTPTCTTTVCSIPTSTCPTSTRTTCPTSTRSTCPTSTRSTCPTSTRSTCPTSTLSTCPTSTLSTCPTSTRSTCPTSTRSTCPTSTRSTCPTSTRSTCPTSTRSTCPTSTRSTCPTSTRSTCPTSTRSTCPTSTRSTCPTSTRSTCPTSTRSTCPTSTRITCPTSTRSTCPTSTCPTSTRSTCPTSTRSTCSTSTTCPTLSPTTCSTSTTETCSLFSAPPHEERTLCCPQIRLPLTPETETPFSKLQHNRLQAPASSPLALPYPPFSIPNLMREDLMRSKIRQTTLTPTARRTNNWKDIQLTSSSVTSHNQQFEHNVQFEGNMVYCKNDADDVVLDSEETQNSAGQCDEVEQEETETIPNKVSNPKVKHCPGSGSSSGPESVSVAPASTAGEDAEDVAGAQYNLTPLIPIVVQPCQLAQLPVSPSAVHSTAQTTNFVEPAVTEEIQIIPEFLPTIPEPEIEEQNVYSHIGCEPDDDESEIMVIATTPMNPAAIACPPVSTVGRTSPLNAPEVKVSNPNHLPVTSPCPVTTFIPISVPPVTNNASHGITKPVMLESKIPELHFNSQITKSAVMPSNPAVQPTAPYVPSPSATMQPMRQQYSVYAVSASFPVNAHPPKEQPPCISTGTSPWYSAANSQLLTAPVQTTVLQSQAPSTVQRWPRSFSVLRN